MNKGILRGIVLALLLLSVCSLSAVNVGVLFVEGGVFMYIISFLLVIMLILAIIKYWQLAIKEKINAQSFYLKLKGYIKNKQIDEAIRVSAQFKKTTLGFIFWSGLLGYSDALKSGKTGNSLRAHLQNSFDEAGLQKISDVEAGLFWFDIIAQVATLLGLLGTIVGLINSFDALANAPEAEKTQLLTSGIAMAMGTTGYGLVVAIPTMFIKGALQSRADKIIDNIDEFSVKTINQINYTLED